MPTRRRHPHKCIACGNWRTRHPSKICRDCRPHLGTTIVRLSTAIEKGTHP